MSDEPKHTFRVSALETQPDGRRMWTTLLTTSDQAAAEALVNSIQQDGVLAKYEVIPPPKKKR